MLEMRDVSLKFSHDERELLSSVNLAVKPGSCTGLTGPSGGGKTLIGLVAAGVIPDLIRAGVTGTIRSAMEKKPHSTSAAIVFQDPSFQLLSNTVYDELLFTPRKLGWPESDTRKDFERIVAGLDITHLLNRNPRELSMGEVQRVAVGVALIQRPRIIVLDEPTQYIDRFHVEKTLEFISEWSLEYKASVLLIEHQIPLLKRFCDRTYYVENGRVRPAELSEHKFPLNGSPMPRNHESCTALKNVCYHYKHGKPVLNDISLSVSCGESVAILGPNGSGKSTLAKIICGLYKPVSGEITLFGKAPSNGSWFREIGYVMQDPDRQIFASTVMEECSFGPRNFGLSPAVYEKTITQYLKGFHLEGFEDRNPLSLSYGEKRRMNIIGVLSYDPSVIILDEPTSGLDFKNQEILLKHIKQWNALGKTIIIITHDFAFARAACLRAIFIDNGIIVRDTPLNRMCNEDVISLYAEK